MLRGAAALRAQLPAPPLPSALRLLLRRAPQPRESAGAASGARAALPRDAIAFQTDLEELLEEPPPPFLAGTHLLVALLFVLLLLLATLARVDVVVTAGGRLRPDAPPVVLQPIERAIVRELRVRPGDQVARGQVLAVLDATFAQADTAALAEQRGALLAQLHRLSAELGDEPAAEPARGDEHGRLQAVLQTQRQSLRATHLAALDEEIEGLAADIRRLEHADPALAEQAAIARDVEAMRTKLLADQVGSRLSLLGARTQRLQAEQALGETRHRIDGLIHAMRARQEQRRAYLDDWRRQLLEETVRVRGDLMRIEQALAKARRLSELTEVTAPQAGTVLEVARRSAGSVLLEGEPLIVLVPSGVPLLAEIALPSIDVGHVRPGDEVRLKVDAFPFQRHGTLHGRLRSVSQESFAQQEPASVAQGMPSGPGPGAGAVHVGRVEIEGPGLTRLPEGARLIPGMTLTAEIEVGTRSVASYFLAPLLRGLQESLREP
jgi:HlyD family secretion protein